MAWSIGDELPDGRQRSPSAERNKVPILEVLKRVLPATGLVLEIGSGTGQHVVHFARALPGLTWQPSDVDEDLRRSALEWIAADHLPNVRAPVALDVMAPSWPVSSADAVLAINVVHVSPWEATVALCEGAARLLPEGGALFLYGPYRRGGQHTAPSNERFDAELRAHDPRWGVRDLERVIETAQQAGLALDEVIDMPANNASVILRKRAGRATLAHPRTGAHAAAGSR